MTAKAKEAKSEEPAAMPFADQGKREAAATKPGWAGPFVSQGKLKTGSYITAKKTAKKEKSQARHGLRAAFKQRSFSFYAGVSHWAAGRGIIRAPRRPHS